MLRRNKALRTAQRVLARRGTSKHPPAKPGHQFDPAGATGLYWALYRYYRNTDKSHAYERETTVDAKPVTGSERKVSEVKGTQQQRISGNNA